MPLRATSGTLRDIASLGALVQTGLCGLGSPTARPRSDAEHRHGRRVGGPRSGQPSMASGPAARDHRCVPGRRISPGFSNTPIRRSGRQPPDSRTGAPIAAWRASSMLFSTGLMSGRLSQRAHADLRSQREPGDRRSRSPRPLAEGGHRDLSRDRLALPFQNGRTPPWEMFMSRDAALSRARYSSSQSHETS